jgi:uncharacterized membrane protein YhhN
MNLHLIPVPLVFASIGFYMYARRKNNLRLVRVFQPLTTLLVIAVAATSLFSDRSMPGFTYWILAGLGFSLVGDIINIDMKRDSVLIAGIIAFIFAYLTYPVALILYNGFHRPDLYVGIAMIVMYVVMMAVLWPGLGTMRVPVLIYGLIMPFMFSRAISTFFGDSFSITQAVLLTTGTLALLVGDFEYAMHRFRDTEPWTIGPLLYEGGQLLVALSLSYFPV